MLVSLLRCVSALNGVATLAGGSLNMHTIIHLLHGEQTLATQSTNNHGTGEVIYNVLIPIENLFYLMFEHVQMGVKKCYYYSKCH